MQETKVIAGSRFPLPYVESYTEKAVFDNGYASAAAWRTIPDARNTPNILTFSSEVSDHKRFIHFK
jgi:hypothetical protein